MLALLLFNIGGYTLLFQFFIYQSDNSILSRINNNSYNRTDLVEVKIPVHLAIEDWATYQPISGQVQFKNNNYNYAELKLTRDTMYLLCIPNQDKSRLANANIIYAKEVSDIPANKKSTLPSIKKTANESIYNYSFLPYNPVLPVKDVKTRPDHSCVAVITTSIDVQGQPPEAWVFLS